MSPKELTRQDIIRVAGTFTWTKKMPKWRVVVNNREFPARPLVLRAAQVAPNDPTNSHQAVAILQSLGFETHYFDHSTESRNMGFALHPNDSDDVGSIAKLVSEIAKQIPKAEWDRVPADLSKNLDHYLYGREKKE